MAGLYIHIPFCRKACHYCNFHFSTRTSYVDQMVDAICTELEQRSNLLTESLSTIYWGGGTPSILTPEQIEKIFTIILKCYQLTETPEITLEANPEDVDRNNLQFWVSTFNRLSIGIQSFFAEDLRWMNRSHDENQAHQCIRDVIQFGFSDINIDLIYGSPTTSLAKWLQNLEYFTSYGIPHLSAYHLTVEPRTALEVMIRKGKTMAPHDEAGTVQMKILMEKMDKLGYWHYEISNFCKPDRISRHNSAYWKGEPYLGIGPGAHSYLHPVRYWNVAHNHQYMKGIKTHGIPPGEKEVLSIQTQYNEYIMLGLRTMWGVSEDDLNLRYPAYSQLFRKTLQPYIVEGKVELIDGVYRLTSEGKLIADRITSELFVLE